MTAPFDRFHWADQHSHGRSTSTAFLTACLRSSKRGVRFEGNFPKYCAFWDTELLVKLTDARLVGSPLAAHSLEPDRALPSELAVNTGTAIYHLNETGRRHPLHD